MKTKTILFSTLLIALLLIFSLSITGCSKKNCITQKCGYVWVLDPNYGAQTIYRSPDFCASQADINAAVQEADNNYSGSYTVQFVETRTQEVCN